MGISRRVPQPEIGVYGNQNRNQVGRYYHRVVTTTSGTIDTTNSDQTADSAVSIVKTAAKTGRYTITLPTPHRKLLYVHATPIGTADTGYGAITKGLPMYVRNDAVNTAGTLDIQFVQGDTNWNDGEVADGASFMIEIVVSG